MLIIASCFSDKSRTTKKTLCCGSNQCKVYNHWHCSFEKCNWTALHSTNLEFPYFPVTKVSKFFLEGVPTPQTIAYSSNYPYRVVIWAHNSVSIKVNKWTCGFLFILDFDSNSQEVAGHVTSSASHSFGKFVLHVKKKKKKNSHTLTNMAHKFQVCGAKKLIENSLCIPRIAVFAPSSRLLIWRTLYRCI